MTLQEMCDYVTRNFYDDPEGRIMLKTCNKKLNVKGLNYLLKRFYEFAKSNEIH